MAGTLPAFRPGIAVFTAGAFGVAAAPALAQAPPPPPVPNVPAIYQYREELPTGAGPVVPRPATTRVTPLPAGVRARVSAVGGADAPLLEKVATSSDYGAPQGPRRHDVRRGPASGEPSPLPEATLRRALGASFSALPGAELRFLALLGAMLAVGAALAVGSRRGPA